MTCDGAVCCLGFNGFPIRRQKHGCHQTKRAKALRDGVRLYIAVVVLTGPDKTAFPLKGASNHIVDQAVLIGDARVGIFVFEFSLIGFFEQILKATVVLLEDRIFCRQEDRPVFLSTKNTILKQYDGRFKDLFEETY